MARCLEIIGSFHPEPFLIIPAQIANQRARNTFHSSLYVPLVYYRSICSLNLNSWKLRSLSLRMARCDTPVIDGTWNVVWLQHLSRNKRTYTPGWITNLTIVRRLLYYLTQRTTQKNLKAKPGRFAAFSS